MIIIPNKSNKIGAKFENRLTKQFEKYRNEGKAYIFKVPTEFIVLRKGAKIVSAFPKKQSPCLDLRLKQQLIKLHFLFQI